MDNMTPVYAAIGEILKEHKSEMSAELEALRNVGPDALNRALLSSELSEKKHSITEHCHTMLHRKGACPERKTILNPYLKKGLV